ncbi:MAG: FixH family protein [Dysgonamonadaceae bacterium]|jgi:hypothetical protein|nr:FixH family protein [Dysgonamonadaceae bacterium]
MKRFFKRGINPSAKKTARGLIPLLIAVLFVSCDKDDNTEPVITDPAAGLKKIQEFAGGNYTVTAWNETGEWRLGYTKVYFTVQDKNGAFVENAGLSAFPEMDMGMMKHSTPRAEITKAAGKALYETYYAFLMYSGQGNGKWYYDLKLTVNNITDSINGVEIDVKNVFRPDGQTERKVILSLVAVDGSGKRYVVTLVEPLKPKVGVNDITAYIHERVDANTYNPVENFTLKLDPRMPSMENHSSPNNVDLTWNATERIYKGKVNFSMTGYWTLNLILQDDKGGTLYGNAVSGDIEASSLYFEVEF